MFSPGDFSRCCLVTAACAVLSACGPKETQVEVKFAAVVGAEPFSCSKKFDNLGTKQSSVEFTDFKLFVRAPALFDTAGKRVPLVLEQDGLFQLDDVALLDFEDGSGTCIGTPETRLVVKGTVPANTEFTALEFDLGFPEDKNHLDATTAKSPLNVPGMWWSWTGGFKFLRLDAKVPSTYYFHLGASGCDGTPATGFSCKTTNLAHVRIEKFNVATTTVRFDVAKMYEKSDLTLKPDMVIDVVPGCMSESTDPECTPLFGQLGLGAMPQAVFSAHQTLTR